MRLMKLKHDTDRRAVLKGLGSVSAGLVLAMQLPTHACAQSGAAAVLNAGRGEGVFAPNAFVRIGSDDVVTVVVKHIEFGQGPFTGLATLVAEELDADWSQMRAESAPANNELYKNLVFGLQGTGGSTAMANSYEQMRKAGAAARAMLVQAAAREWGVPASEITISKGQITHAGSAKSGSFGTFAEKAAKLPVPTDVKLKDPSQFRLIGTDRPKLDSAAKSMGKATYTLDVVRPDMLTVLIARPKRFGAKLKDFDDTVARKVKGVVDVKALPNGVAVYAHGFWAAKKGRDALKVNWDTSKAEARSSVEIINEYKSAAKKSGKIAAERGDVAAAFGADAKTDGKTFDAEYTFPFLAHAPMETLDCVLEWSEKGATALCGSQMPTLDQTRIAQILGLRPEEVTLSTLLAGGSFGRRATPTSDVASEAAWALKALGQKRPVKIVWTREDDIRNGYYRPAFVHRLKGAVDKNGDISHWDQVIVGQSIMEGTPFEGMMEGSIDPTMTEGASDLPYSIENFRVSVHSMKNGIPPLWWRSVGHTHTAFTTETFLDVLLDAGGKDPVEGRLALLGDLNPRHKGVLQAAAKLADWGSTVPEGRARGVALHKSFNSYVAQVAEVGRDDDGLVRVYKVWCAIDCGVPVNPNIIRAQIEGGLGYGLGHALFGQITVENGAVQQSNFHDYESLRIQHMPEVEVEVIKSAEPPTGVGEPGTPPIAPAVANAWAALTGEHVRLLPFSKRDEYRPLGPTIIIDKREGGST